MVAYHDDAFLRQESHQNRDDDFSSGQHSQFLQHKFTDHHGFASRRRYYCRVQVAQSLRISPSGS